MNQENIRFLREDYLCLNCRKIVASMQSGKCLCGNILIDADGGRGGFNDASQALILKIE